MSIFYGFNVGDRITLTTHGIEEELEVKGSPATLFSSDIIYKLIEDYEAWYKKTKFDLERDKRGEIVHPGKFQILGDYIFRISKPAVFGVRILAGRLRLGRRLVDHTLHQHKCCNAGDAGDANTNQLRFLHRETVLLNPKARTQGPA